MTTWETFKPETEKAIAKYQESKQSSMSKYTLVTISGIHTQIALKTKTKGYTIGILEAFMPDAEKWSDQKSSKWIDENNKRMEAICKMLNDSGL